MSIGSWRGNLNKRFGRPRRGWKDSTEVYLESSGMGGRELDSYASRYRQVADSCENININKTIKHNKVMSL
jgi:hypothetical protein